MTSRTGDLIEPLIEFVCGTPAGAVPADVVEMTQILTLDALGVAQAGMLASSAPQLLAALKASAYDHGTRVLGQRLRLPPAEAALCNGALIHSTEFDPAFDDGLIHPLAGTLPAALAAAEETGSTSGPELLAAVAIGIEVACRIADAATGTPLFYRCGLLGGFGGAAAVIRLRHLDPVAALHTFGITYSQGGAPWQPHDEGAAIHGALPGFGARSALIAAKLAAGGVAGPTRVLEGEHGYYQTYEAGVWDRNRALDGLGSRWLLREVSLKPYPCGRLTHGGIAGILQLRDQFGLTPGSVRRIDVIASAIIADRTGRVPDPGASTVHQRLSVPFTVAQALIHGRVGLGEFGPASASDPRVRALMARIRVVPSRETPVNSLSPVLVRVERIDGSVLEANVVDLLRSRANPLSRDQHLAKLRHCWELSGQSSCRRLDSLVSAVEGLDRAADLSRLWPALWP